VNELVVARHGESESSVLDRLNGDPSVDVHLTQAGREQARRLGHAVGGVDLVAHTEFGRTRETAELAWPQTPLLLVPDLNEIKFGQFEGTHWNAGYHEWVLTSPPDEMCPGDGESRLAAVERYLRGYRLLLERSESRIALVGHGAPIRYLLLALEDQPPVRILERIEPARPYTVEADALEAAVRVLERWVEAPAF
jgi:broad specificity phosphatase PhoE